MLVNKPIKKNSFLRAEQVEDYQNGTEEEIEYFMCSGDSEREIDIASFLM